MHLHYLAPILMGDMEDYLVANAKKLLERALQHFLSMFRKCRSVVEAPENMGAKYYSGAHCLQFKINFSKVS